MAMIENAVTTSRTAGYAIVSLRRSRLLRRSATTQLFATAILIATFVSQGLSRIAFALAPPRAPPTRSVLTKIDTVRDLAGNGTAFALKLGAVPFQKPQNEPQQYMIDTFSPGFVVDNVMSSDTCRKLVNLCEEIGWEKRWSQNLGVVTMFIDEDLERHLFSRLYPFLPKHMGGEPIGINRRWAVIKYGPGQYMNSHIDGHVPGVELSDGGDALQYKKGTRSYMSCLFWLDDDVVGGETVFTFPQGGVWVKIPPRTGAALLFNHGQNAVSNPLHHGGTVESGTKYLVRSDIIYGHE